jgi:hypothetical protein
MEKINTNSTPEKAVPKETVIEQPPFVPDVTDTETIKKIGAEVLEAQNRRAYEKKLAEVGGDQKKLWAKEAEEARVEAEWEKKEKMARAKRAAEAREKEQQKIEDAKWFNRLNAFLREDLFRFFKSKKED